MDLTFERGDPSRPCGHALLYFTTGSPERVLATYLVIPPIALNLAKYMPPMFAANLPLDRGGRHRVPDEEQQRDGLDEDPGPVRVELRHAPVVETVQDGHHGDPEQNELPASSKAGQIP